MDGLRSQGDGVVSSEVGDEVRSEIWIKAL